MAQPMVSVSLRMSPEGAERLKAISRRHRELSQGAIVESLVNYAVSDEQLEKRILKGEKVDFFRLLGDAFHLAEWGDHAFRKGWVTWSLETYAKLDESASGVEGIQQIARFRLGSSWMDFAMQIRERALFVTSQSEWNEYYMCAIDGLLVSIAYHRLFNEALKKSGEKASPGESGAHPVVLFNESCGWSLVGKYLSERNAGRNSKLVEKARESLGKKVSSDKTKSGTEKKKDDLQFKPDPATKLAIQESRRCLEQISSRPGQSFGRLPIAETHWLIDLAKRDPDLEFLSTVDSENFWKLIEQKEKEVSLIKSFFSLRGRIPKEVSELIPKLPDNA